MVEDGRGAAHHIGWRQRPVPGLHHAHDSGEEHRSGHSEELLVLQQQQTIRVQWAVLSPCGLYPQQHGLQTHEIGQLPDGSIDCHTASELQTSQSPATDNDVREAD